MDFSSSINPLGPPPGALRAARSALRRASRYPDPGAETLRKSLASWLGVNPALLTLGNGCTEIIHHLVRCRSPRRVTVASPSFSEYARAAKAAGVEVDHFILSSDYHFALDVEALAMAAGVSEMVFFCNPSSPSGRLYRREELLPLLEVCRKKDGLLVVDESFMGFCLPQEAEEATMMARAGEKGLVVISTFTKLFALAGLRGPGWLVGPEDLIQELEESYVPWRVNCVADAAAQASLRDRGYLHKTRLRVSAWRESLSRRLQSTGLFKVYPSRANFLLLQWRGEPEYHTHLFDELGRKGLLVRSCHDFHGLGEGFFRVAVRRPRENRRLLEALDEVRSGVLREGCL